MKGLEMTAARPDGAWGAKRFSEKPPRCHSNGKRVRLFPRERVRHDLEAPHHERELDIKELDGGESLENKHGQRNPAVQQTHLLFLVQLQRAVLVPRPAGGTLGRVPPATHLRV